VTYHLGQALIVLGVLGRGWSWPGADRGSTTQAFWPDVRRAGSRSC